MKGEKGVEGRVGWEGPGVKYGRIQGAKSVEGMKVGREGRGSMGR